MILCKTVLQNISIITIVSANVYIYLYTDTPTHSCIVNFKLTTVLMLIQKLNSTYEFGDYLICKLYLSYYITIISTDVNI